MEIFYRKLKIGYFVEDDFLKYHPGCARVVQKAADVLLSQGHSVFKVSDVESRTWMKYIIKVGSTTTTNFYEVFHLDNKVLKVGSF